MQLPSFGAYINRAARAAIPAIALICVFLFAGGVPAMAEIGMFHFLPGTEWRLYRVLRPMVELLEILYNLMENGIRYSEAGDRVDLLSVPGKGNVFIVWLPPQP